MEASKAYDQICQLARDHALILQAAGGVVTIVHPDTQRAEGLYCHAQYVHGKGKHPEGHCRCKTEGNGACLKSLKNATLEELEGANKL